jgi:hypothetical protein
MSSGAPPGRPGRGFVVHDGRQRALAQAGTAKGFISIEDDDGRRCPTKGTAKLSARLASSADDCEVEGAVGGVPAESNV